MIAIETADKIEVSGIYSIVAVNGREIDITAALDRSEMVLLNKREARILENVDQLRYRLRDIQNTIDRLQDDLDELSQPKKK